MLLVHCCLFSVSGWFGAVLVFFFSIFFLLPETGLPVVQLALTCNKRKQIYHWNFKEEERLQNTWLQCFQIKIKCHFGNVIEPISSSVNSPKRWATLLQTPASLQRKKRKWIRETMGQMYNRFAGRTFKRWAIDRTTTKISSGSLQITSMEYNRRESDLRSCEVT